MQNLNDAIAHRIKAVNMRPVELVYVNLGHEHGGAICARVEGKGVVQMHIPKPMIPALISGRRNKNLDRKLTL